MLRLELGRWVWARSGIGWEALTVFAGEGERTRARIHAAGGILGLWFEIVS